MPRGAKLTAEMGLKVFKHFPYSPGMNPGDYYEENASVTSPASFMP